MSDNRVYAHDYILALPDDYYYVPHYNGKKLDPIMFSPLMVSLLMRLYNYQVAGKDFYLLPMMKYTNLIPHHLSLLHYMKSMDLIEFAGEDEQCVQLTSHGTSVAEMFIELFDDPMIGFGFSKDPIAGDGLRDYIDYLTDEAKAKQ